MNVRKLCNQTSLEKQPGIFIEGRYKSYLIVLCIVGIALRSIGLNTELWLDEIWSINGIQTLSSPIHVVTKLHSDNNHILNSLWLYILGPQQSAFLYRLPSFLCSIASLFAFYMLAKRWLKRDNELLVACTLFTFSYEMILYATEARGYSSLVCFSLLCAYYFDRADATSAKPLWLITTICATLALLSHYSFLFFYVAATAFQIVRAKGVPKGISLFHLPFLGICLCLYLFHLQHLPPGTGSMSSHSEVVLSAITAFHGAPRFSPYDAQEGALHLLFACCVVIILFRGLLQSWHDKDSLWVFFLHIIVFVPLAVLLVLQPRVLYVRYFLVSMLFAYLLFPRGVTSSRIRNIITAGIVFFSLIQTKDLLLYGRGGYQQALQDITSVHKTGVIHILPENHFRDSMLFSYFNHENGRKLVFEKAQEKPQQVDWTTTYTYEPKASFPNSIELEEGVFEHYKSYPTPKYSGWILHLYQKTSQPSSIPRIDVPADE